ncbi:UTRA domain-containing protein, partial [Brucella sp. NBRC 113783]
MRRGLADDMPINLGIAFHPVALFPDLGARREAGVSVTEIYRDHGVTDYFRKSTTIFTRRAEPEESRLLRQHPDHPVMIVTKIDVDAKGTALGYSEAVWAGDRVQFSFDSLDDPFVGEEGKTP